jgi:LPXTG-motif cell wall-anchored protein
MPETGQPILPMLVLSLTLAAAGLGSVLAARRRNIQSPRR